MGTITTKIISSNFFFCLRPNYLRFPNHVFKICSKHYMNVFVNTRLIVDCINVKLESNALIIVHSVNSEMFVKNGDRAIPL